MSENLEWDRDELDWLREESDQDWAERYNAAWDRLEALGVLTRDDDWQQITLTELERLCAYIKEE